MTALALDKDDCPDREFKRGTEGIKPNFSPVAQVSPDMFDTFYEPVLYERNTSKR
jgi:hypothetical protein